MIKIEFPAHSPEAARVFGEALLAYAERTTRVPTKRVRQDDGSVKVVAQDDLDHKHLVTGVNAQTGEAHVVNTTTGEIYSDANGLDENTSSAGDTARLDTKGVAFDVKYCANAADPFYATGKRSGQWKCKRGVDDPTYDAWYSEQLAASATQTAADEDTDPTPTVATGAAFGAAVTQPATSAAPADLGQFMAWVSEQMVAGRLQQATIDGAYTALGIRIQDLVPPTPPAVVTNNLTALHNFLAPIVAGA